MFKNVCMLHLIVETKSFMFSDFQNHHMRMEQVDWLNQRFKNIYCRDEKMQCVFRVNKGSKTSKT